VLTLGAVFSFSVSSIIFHAGTVKNLLQTEHCLKKLRTEPPSLLITLLLGVNPKESSG
jgi:hypothetical protein